MDTRKFALSTETRIIPIENIIILNEDMPFPVLPEEMVESLKESIVNHGLVYNPVVIPVPQEEGTKYYLIDGRSRIHALVKLGCREIPCTVINALPEEKKALSYIVEYYRRHVPEDERKKGEEQLKEALESARVGVREKLRSLLNRQGVPKGVIAQILKDRTSREISSLYSMLKENVHTLIPILKATLASSSQLSEEEVSETQELIEKLEEERKKLEEEKKNLENKLSEIAREKEKYASRVKQLEEKISYLEEEIERREKEAQELKGIELTPNHPKIKQLIEKYAEKLAEEKAHLKADEIAKEAVRQYLREKAEIEKQAEIFKKERNIYVRKCQDLEEKNKELEEKLKYYQSRERNWQDTFKYQREILLNILSPDGILKRFDAVIKEVDAIIYHLVTFRDQVLVLNQTSTPLQENYLISLEQKKEELEGKVTQLSAVVEKIQSIYRTSHEEKQ